MNLISKISSIVIFFAVFIAGCSDDIPSGYIPLYQLPVFDDPNNWNNEADPEENVQKVLKILAIGNSFTNNSTVFMPWLVSRLNSDSVLIAKLVRDGSSLAMHWTSHAKNSPDYNMYVSQSDEWRLTDIHTIDEALTLHDWDIIVIQQASGLAGDYSTYQPALEYLVRLFKESNPNAKLAWHYIWAYKPGTVHPEFARYGNDPFTMYCAILAAGDMASANMQLSIPSTGLIWQMRKEFTEVEDGFSTDGFHISSGFASYALSALWYECLVVPFVGTSSLSPYIYPKGVNPAMAARAENIIKSLVSTCGNGGARN